MNYVAMPGQRVRHLKRGSVYHTTAVATLQMSGTRPLVEGDKLVIYTSVTVNPQHWARELSEFEDGRFQLWGRVEDDSRSPAAIAERDASIVAEAEVILGALLMARQEKRQFTPAEWMRLRHVYECAYLAENHRAERAVNEALTGKR